MTSVSVLGNSSTSAGREFLDRVVGALTLAGTDAKVLDARTTEEAADVARSAVADGIDILVAVGGDGVVTMAVDAVAESDTILAIVPDGTGNDFARALGLLDGHFDDHVQRVLRAPAAVDAIRTNHGWVASVATLGFSGDVTARANSLRWPRGQQRYTVATFLQLPRLRTHRVRIEIDGRPMIGHDGNTTLLAIGNTEFFGGGMKVCPGASSTDGRLDVVSIGAVPRRTFARNFAAVFSGRHVERDEVAVDAGSTVTVESVVEGDGETDDELMMWADGEPLGPLPVQLDAVPGALRVAGATPGRHP